MADLNEVASEVHQIHEKVNELCQWKAALTERFKRSEGRIERLQQIIYGNPKPENGLISKMQKLWHDDEDMEKRSSRWRDFWMSAIKVLACAAVIAIIQWLLFLWRSL